MCYIVNREGLESIDVKKFKRLTGKYLINILGFPCLSIQQGIYYFANTPELDVVINKNCPIGLKILLWLGGEVKDGK